MPDWKSTHEMELDHHIFIYMIHLAAGIYFWEFLSTLWFEWFLITRQIRFLRTLPLYLTLRYITLLSMIITLVTFDRIAPMDCQAVLFIFQLAGSAVGGLATIALALRAFALWQRRSVRYSLVVLLLGHWALIIHGILVEGHYVPGEGCVLTRIHNIPLTANLIYTMVLDFVILILVAKAVRPYTFTYPDGQRSVAHVVRHGGTIYFLASLIANMIATVFMILNRNPIMSVMANIPAALACSIAAMRATRELAVCTPMHTPEFHDTIVSAHSIKFAQRNVEGILTTDSVIASAQASSSQPEDGTDQV